MNAKIKTLKNNSLPLWLLVLLTTALVLTISQVGMSAYKSIQSKNPEILAERSQLESTKELLLSQPDVVNINWLRTLNPLVKNVEGNLIWSATLQQGILEFLNLPKIDDNQYYQLWIHDLSKSSDQATLAAVFKGTKKEKLLMAFDTVQIKSPYKFELVLHTDDQSKNQPLLLAQP